MGLKNIARDFKLKLTLKKMSWSSFELSSMFTMPRRIIILLPTKRAHIPDLRGLINELGDMFSSAKLFLISQPETEDLGDIGREPRAERLKPNETDMTWSGLPGKHFTEKIRQLRGELLIDLAVNKNHFNAFLAACSQAPIRIGNFGSWGLPIYNLEIKTNYLQNEQLIIKSIMEVLKNFRAGVNN